MSPITVDPVVSLQLREARQPLEIRDPAGQILGHFVPLPTSSREPKISEEELQRREQAGGGRSLAAILADLEKRACPMPNN